MSSIAPALWQQAGGSQDSVRTVPGEAAHGLAPEYLFDRARVTTGFDGKRPLRGFIKTG